MGWNRVNRGRRVRVDSPNFVEVLRLDPQDSDIDSCGQPWSLWLDAEPIAPMIANSAHAEIIAEITYGVGALSRIVEVSVGRGECVCLPCQSMSVRARGDAVDASWVASDVTAMAAAPSAGRVGLARRSFRIVVPSASTTIVPVPPFARDMHLCVTPSRSSAQLMVEFFAGEAAGSTNYGFVPAPTLNQYRVDASDGMPVPPFARSVRLTNTVAAEVTGLCTFILSI